LSIVKIFSKNTALVVVAAALIVISVVAFAGRSTLREFIIRWRTPDLPEEQGPGTPTPSIVVRTPVATPTPVLEMNLAVPFSAQAPHGNWELPYQETCEEASAMLVDAFWSGRTFTPEQADAELLSLVRWQQGNLGFYFHTTSEQTALILRQYYGYRDVRVHYDISIEDIKREVSAGRPVIVPLAGRVVGNRYYRQPGPVYHMLVVKGFTADGQIITNDVGTLRGHNYVYDEEAFLSSIHDVPTGGDDWPVGVDPAEYILTGRRAMIVVYPN
jgi:hypothetical protein